VFDDLAAYFHENVLESYMRFLNHLAGAESGFSEDLRNALAAASAVFHLREHLPESHRPTRAEVAQECPAYDILGDVVNASKHGKLTRSPRHIAGPDCIEEITETTKYRDHAGVYFHSRRRVVVTTLDGREHDLAELLTGAINFWLTKLADLGILPRRPPFQPPFTQEAPSRAQAEAQKQHLLMRQGVRFRMKERLLEYDYETRTAKPWHVDKSEYRFWRPCRAELRAENPRTGHAFTIPIELSEAEEESLEQLDNDADRQRLIHEIAVRQGVLEEAQRRIREDEQPE